MLLKRLCMKINGLDHETQCLELGSGAPERIRTSGLCLRRAALYPAELRVLNGFIAALSLGFYEVLFSFSNHWNAFAPIMLQ